MGRKKGKKKKSGKSKKKSSGSGSGGSKASSGSSFQFLLRQYGSHGGSSQSFFDPFDSLSNSDLRNGFKHLAKKDETTKIKALKTLIKGISDESVENVAAILPKFVKTFSRLCIDNSHKIREMTYLLFTVIADKCKDLLTPHLKDYMGPWVMGMHDLEREVRDSATRGFEKIFSKRKRRIRALNFTMESLLQYFISNFNKTMDQLTPRKSAKLIEKKERYHRVLTCSILSLDYLIRIVPSSISKYDLFHSLCGNQKFWLFLKVKNFPRIRSATFSLLSTICRDLKELIDDSYLPFLTPLVFNVFREKEPMVQKSCFEALIAYLKTFPQCWGFVKDVWKQIFPQLWRFLKHPEVSQTNFFNILLPFLSLLNYDILGGKNENTVHFFESFFGNLWFGFEFMMEVRKDTEALVRIANAYLECLMYVMLQSNLYINVDEAESDRIKNVEEEEEGEEEEGEEDETPEASEQSKEDRRELILKSFYEPIVGKFLVKNIIHFFFFRKESEEEEGKFSRYKTIMKLDDEVTIREQVVKGLVMCLLRLTLHSGVCSSGPSQAQQGGLSGRKGGQFLFDLVFKFWSADFIRILVPSHDEDGGGEDMVMQKTRNGLILKFISSLIEKSLTREELVVFQKERFLKPLFWRILKERIVCSLSSKKKRRRNVEEHIEYFKLLNRIISICEPFIKEEEEEDQEGRITFEELVKIFVIEQKLLVKRARVISKYLRLREEIYSILCNLYRCEYHNKFTFSENQEDQEKEKEEWITKYFEPFFKSFVVDEEYGHNSPHTIMFFINHLPKEILRRTKFSRWLLRDYVSDIVTKNPVMFLLDEDTVISSTQRKKIKKMHLDDLSKILEFCVFFSEEEEESKIDTSFLFEFVKKNMEWIKKDFLSLQDVKTVNQKYFTYAFLQDYDDDDEDEEEEEEEMSSSDDDEEEKMRIQKENEKIVFGEQIVLKLKLLDFLVTKIIKKKKIFGDGEQGEEVYLFSTLLEEQFEQRPEELKSLCRLFILSHKYVSNNYYYGRHQQQQILEKEEEEKIIKSIEEYCKSFWVTMMIIHPSSKKFVSDHFEELFLTSTFISELSDPKNKSTKKYLKIMKMAMKRMIFLSSNLKEKVEEEDLIEKKLFFSPYFWKLFRSDDQMLLMQISSEKTKKYKMFVLLFMWYMKQRYFVPLSKLSSSTEEEEHQQQQQKMTIIASIEKIFGDPMIQNELFFIRHELSSEMTYQVSSPSIIPSPSDAHLQSFENFEVDFLMFYEYYFLKMYLLQDEEDNNATTRWFQKVKKLLCIDHILEEKEEQKHNIRVYRVRSVLRFVLSEMLKRKDYEGIFNLYLSVAYEYIFGKNSEQQQPEEEMMIEESWIHEHVIGDEVSSGSLRKCIIGWDLFSIVHDSFFYFWERKNHYGRKIRSVISDQSHHHENSVMKCEKFKTILEEQLLIISSLFITDTPKEKKLEEEKEFKYLLKYVYVLLMVYSSFVQKKKRKEEEVEDEEEEQENVINIQNVLRIVLATMSEKLKLSTFQTTKYIYSYIIQFRCSSSSSSSDYLFTSQQHQEEEGKCLVSSILKFLETEVWNNHLKMILLEHKKSQEKKRASMGISKQDIQMMFYMTRLYSFILNELILQKRRRRRKGIDLEKMIEECRQMLMDIFFSLSHVVVCHEATYLRKMVLVPDLTPLENIQNEEEEESIVLSTLYSRTTSSQDGGVNNEEEERNQWFVLKYCLLKVCGNGLMRYYSSTETTGTEEEENKEDEKEEVVKKEEIEMKLLSVLRKSMILELQKLSLFLLKSTFDVQLLFPSLEKKGGREGQGEGPKAKEEAKQKKKEEEFDDDKPFIVHPIAVVKKKKSDALVVNIEKEIRLIDSSSSENEELSLFGYIFSWDYFVFMFEKMISTSSSSSLPKKTKKMTRKLLEKKKVKILNYLKHNPSQTYVPFLNLIFFQFLLTDDFHLHLPKSHRRQKSKKKSQEGEDEDEDEGEGEYSDYEEEEEEEVSPIDDEGVIKKEDRIFLDRILFSFLLNFSTLFRSFAQDNVNNEEMRKKIEKYVNIHFSSKIIQKELNSLIKMYPAKKNASKSTKDMFSFLNDDSDDDSDDEERSKSRVEVYKNTRTIKIIYTQDEINLSVTIQVPSNYPFQPLKLLKSSKFGIQRETWNKWILKLTFFLFNKNTSNIVHAVSLFLRNLEHYFKGAQECCICFSIINSLNYKIPDKTCKTCKKMFHGYCLFKWFSKSGKSTCPMCRQIF